ncbi:MAG: hypothetical protein IKR25_01350 [Muribaculaceae bacterium]|nr:hypothetical protein [Muribaculaceae bacterium]
MSTKLFIKPVITLLALIALPVCAWCEDYGITVSGVLVNSDNACAVTGQGIEGRVSFDVASNTLTLNGVTARNIVSHRNGLTINLQGSNRVWLLPGSWYERDEWQGAIQSEGNLTIGGDGSLHVFHARFPDVDDKICAIVVAGGSLTIEGGSLVEAYCPKGLGVSVDGDLTVRSSRLQAGGSFATGIEATGVHLDGCVLHTPAAAAVAVVGPEGDRPGSTSLVLTDIPVTAYNAHAFQSPYQVQGRADFDPDLNVLTLDDFQTMNDEDGLIQRVTPLAFSHLVLNMTGDNILDQFMGVVHGNSLTVDGDGELQLVGAALSVSLGKLTLNGGSTFRTPNAPEGTAYIDSLVVNASTYIGSEIAEQQIKYFELNNSRVVTPTWLTYDAELHQLVPIAGCDMSGDSFLHIAPEIDVTGITDIAPDTETDAAWHDMNGRRISRPMVPGIYMHGRKKVAVTR